MSIIIITITQECLLQCGSCSSCAKHNVIHVYQVSLQYYMSLNLISIQVSTILLTSIVTVIMC